MLSLQQKNEEAEAEFREAVRLKPREANYHQMLGGVLKDG